MQIIAAQGAAVKENPVFFVKSLWKERSGEDNSFFVVIENTVFSQERFPLHDGSVLTGKPLSALAVSRVAFGAIDLFQIAFNFPTCTVGKSNARSSGGKGIDGTPLGFRLRLLLAISSLTQP